MAPQKNTLTGALCHNQTKACQSMTLTCSEVPYPQLSSLDYSVAAQFWGVAFTSVIGLWLFSKGIGLIINMVRNA
ncbi:hypothetical protein [Xenorhabdus littoralis]|uniref:hypothetical protein n=1 Tax=Xenorhabdus littoralis TaxID=2582835 RepID=UPI0029E802C3|nr:hypothetical protein [Xenorhabdus sp. psl]MDX7990798.1 hypothetical protein [Xenorhabdus sp. psl]